MVLIGNARNRRMCGLKISVFGEDAELLVLGFTTTHLGIHLMKISASGEYDERFKFTSRKEINDSVFKFLRYYDQN
jgi:hypothetical protein